MTGGCFKGCAGEVNTGRLSGVVAPTDPTDITLFFPKRGEIGRRMLRENGFFSGENLSSGPAVSGCGLNGEE